jgi:hypothetical protein
MGLAHSPKIVTDSLIFALDAANLKSYPGSGTSWLDLSGNSRTFSLRNSPTFQTSYFSTDGANDHFSTSSSANTFAWTPNGTIGNSTVTIDMWIRSSDTAGRFFTKPWNGSGQYNMWIYPDKFEILASGTTTNSITFGRNLSDGTWTNIVCWVNSTDMGYYINGNAHSGQKAHGLTGDVPSVGNGQIPCGLMTLYPYGDGWAGLTSHAILGDIASAKMYSRVLTAAEVQQNFNALRGRYGI